MTTGRINQIAVKFSRRRARTHECRVCGERGGSNPLAGVEKPESQRRRSFPKIGKTGVVSGSTAPGADLQETEARSVRPHSMPTVSRHGCFFHKTYHANGLCTLLQTRIAVRRGEESGAQVRVLTARLTFGCGPFAVSKGKKRTIRRRACPNR